MVYKEFPKNLKFNLVNRKQCQAIKNGLIILNKISLQCKSRLLKYM